MKSCGGTLGEVSEHYKDKPERLVFCALLDFYFQFFYFLVAGLNSVYFRVKNIK